MKLPNNAAENNLGISLEDIRVFPWGYLGRGARGHNEIVSLLRRHGAKE